MGNATTLQEVAAGYGDENVDETRRRAVSKIVLRVMPLLETAWTENDGKNANSAGKVLVFA
jgi:hypothetical protein